MKCGQKFPPATTALTASFRDCYTPVTSDRYAETYLPTEEAPPPPCPRLFEAATDARGTGSSDPPPPQGPAEAHADVLGASIPHARASPSAPPTVRFSPCLPRRSYAGGQCRDHALPAEHRRESASRHRRQQHGFQEGYRAQSGATKAPRGDARPNSGGVWATRFGRHRSQSGPCRLVRGPCQRVLPPHASTP